MPHLILVLTGLYAVTNAIYIWCLPEHWYVTVPGVAGTGPLNLHFARDVALAFLVSSIALLWAANTSNRAVAVFGAAWPLCHGLYHIGIWFHRGAPLDLIALTNLLGIQIPAALMVWAALSLSSKKA